MPCWSCPPQLGPPTTIGADRASTRADKPARCAARCRRASWRKAIRCAIGSPAIGIGRRTMPAALPRRAIRLGAWPRAGLIGSGCSSLGRRRRGFGSAMRPAPTWTGMRACWTAIPALSPSATTSTGRRACGTIWRRSSTTAATPPFCPATRPSGRPASRRGTAAWCATRRRLRPTRCMTRFTLPISPRCGPIPSWEGRRA